jgi:hypothetical protein
MLPAISVLLQRIYFYTQNDPARPCLQWVPALQARSEAFAVWSYKLLTLGESLHLLLRYPQHHWSRRRIKSVQISFWPPLLSILSGRTRRRQLSLPPFPRTRSNHSHPLTTRGRMPRRSWETGSSTINAYRTITPRHTNHEDVSAIELVKCVTLFSFGNCRK